MIRIIKEWCTGWFFNWPSPISVSIRKSQSSQSQPFLVTGFSATAAVVGWLAVFFLVLKLGGTSEKNHPVHTVWWMSGVWWIQDTKKVLPLNDFNVSKHQLFLDIAIYWLRIMFSREVDERNVSVNMVMLLQGARIHPKGQHPILLVILYFLFYR